PAHGTAVLESGKIRYTPTDPNFNGTDSFTYKITDNGQSGSPLVNDFKSDTATVTITVTPVDDAPVNTVPGGQATNEDTAKVFSIANANAISVADVDVLDTIGGKLKVSLSVGHGTLTLASTT